MVFKGHGPRHRGAFCIGDNAAGRGQVRIAHPDVRIREAFHVCQRAILGRVVIHGIAGREIFLVLRQRTVFDVNRKGHVRHLPVNLGDAVIFDTIGGAHGITQTDPWPLGMIFFALKR